MVKLRFFLFLLLFLLAGQNGFAGLPSFAEGEVKVIEYNLGEVLSDNTIEKSFEFKKRIVSVVTLCDCVHVEVIEKKIPPNDDLYVVKVAFNPEGYEGPVEQDVCLIDEDDSLVTLRIKAFVK